MNEPKLSKINFKHRNLKCISYQIFHINAAVFRFYYVEYKSSSQNLLSVTSLINFKKYTFILTFFNNFVQNYIVHVQSAKFKIKNF